MVTNERESICNEHVCEDDSEERQATPEAPYHYVGSGLPNVFLSGIRYFVCRICGKQAAEIPALKDLMQELGRTVVGKKTPLTGSEIRFLRKRLGKKSAEFAAIVGVSPTYWSRVENDAIEGATGMGGSADRLTRIVYSSLSGDKKLKDVIVNKLDQWLTSITGSGHEEKIVAARVKNKHWQVATEICAA